MAPPKLYMIDISPPVRSVLLTAKALGITLDLKEINLKVPFEGFIEDFSQLRSHHSVPILVDNGYVIWDSHSIIAYLIGKYGNDDSLYPRDLIKRSLIDECLHIDSQVIFSTIGRIIKPMLKSGYKEIPREKADCLNVAYDFLEDFIDNHNWMVGDELTIADLSLIASVTSADILVPIDSKKYPKLCNWIKRSQALPYYHEANQIGLDHFQNLFKTLKI